MIEQKYERNESAKTNVLWVMNNLRIGQSFTVGNSGNNKHHNLKRIEVLMYKVGTTDDLKVSLKRCNVSGVPIGDDLETVYVKTKNITTDTNGEYVKIHFKNKYPLRKNNQYAFLFELLNADSSNRIVVCRSDDTYSGGTLLWTIADTFNKISTSDLIFKIYGRGFRENTSGTIKRTGRSKSFRTFFM